MQEDPRLRMLFDYTVFHIGVYVTLGTAILGAMQLKEKKERCDLLWLIPVLFLLCAGVFGGLLGSSLPSFHVYSDAQPPDPPNGAAVHMPALRSLKQESLTLPLIGPMPYIDLAFWEHVSFWVAMGSALVVGSYHVWSAAKKKELSGRTTRIRILDDITIKVT